MPEPTPIIVSPIVASLMASTTSSSLRDVVQAASTEQGALADSALQPGDVGSIAAHDAADFLPAPGSAPPDVASVPEGAVRFAVIENILSAWQKQGGDWLQIL